MHPELESLVADYVTTVARRFAQLQCETGIAAPVSHIAWVMNGLKSGTLSDGATYSKHGYGCRINVAGREEVDFDFGAHGEIDGFDAWRMLRFARVSHGRHAFVDGTKIQGLLDAAFAAGELDKRGSLYFRREKEPNQSAQTTPFPAVSELKR